MNIKILAVLIWALVFLPATTHAYLDPASGAMIVQLVVAAIAGAVMGGRLYWKKLSGMARRLFTGRPSD